MAKRKSGILSRPIAGPKEPTEINWAARYVAHPELLLRWESQRIIGYSQGHHGRLHAVWEHEIRLTNGIKVTLWSFSGPDANLIQKPRMTHDVNLQPLTGGSK